jgi:ureidoacrylate peracid hydrolase
MNKMDHLNLHEWLRAKARDRLGRDYIYGSFDAAKTALVVVDMQNYFMKPGFLAACPMAIEIVSAINELSANVRSQGGAIVWVQTTAAPEATKDWGVYQELFSPENWQRRNVELSEDHEGYALWPELGVKDTDIFVKKTRFSAFISNSSDIDAQLKSRRIDTLLVSGVATGVCCEATARDAMMLNYRTVMVSDALAAMSLDSHENALKALYGLFTDVQTSTEISEKLF